MEPIIINWNILDQMSFPSKLGKSLKNTLRKFKKQNLFDEISDLIYYLTENEDLITYEHRVKSLHSCELKYKKYYPSTPVEKVFNDVLGIRICIENYNIIDNLLMPKCARVVDMRNGKAKDDGYRAIHVYYQKDHYHYPIELQFMTARDRQFNEWLHVFLYKYVADNSIGQKLKSLYDANIIISEEDFRKEMHKLCVI